MTTANGRSLARATAAVVLTALILRLLHLRYAISSPLTFQLGADEDYYLQFAKAILDGGYASPAFGFMDPLFAYFLAAVGGNQFVAYSIQILVDSGTVYAVALSGRLLGRPWAGLFAAILYAIYSTAILYDTSLLKATWVAALLAWWLVLAISAVQSNSRVILISLGLLLGFGVTLRSNLSLLALVSLFVLPWMASNNAHQHKEGPSPSTRHNGLLIAAGMLVPLVLAMLHYRHIDGRIAVFPTNSGIVLHQLYNPQNPHAVQFAPDFVSYRHPSEIWAGYQREASRRTERDLNSSEASDYWRNEAFSYIYSNPGPIAKAMLAKAVDFTAYTEIPNNRSIADEKLFSPILRWLPPLSGILIALGIPGLLLMARERIAALVWIPFLTVAFTFIVFFAESRFRFHCMPLLALGSGWTLQSMQLLIHRRSWRNLIILCGGIVLLGSLSLYSGRLHPSPPTDWKRITLGYLRTNNPTAAADSLRHWREQLAQPGQGWGDYHETRAILALNQGDYPLAETEGQRAVQLEPTNHVAWFNLAKSRLLQYRIQDALAAAGAAVSLHPSGEYLLLQGSLLVENGQASVAASTYHRIIADASGMTTDVDRQAALAALSLLEAKQSNTEQPPR